jgi:aminoglycoside 3-N-acetyltransferase
MAQGSSDWQSAAKAQVHKTLRRWFSQETRANMKRWQGRARKRVNRFLPLLHGNYTAKELVGELKTRVPEDFEILMVHSAFDRLLPMYKGSALDLLKELTNYCTPNRTLAMPTFMLGGHLYDKAAYFSVQPFDIKRTPSEMGLLSELFRRSPGVVRSLHPTHSICAIGPLAEKLTSGHHAALTRTGYGTPFEFMNHHRTMIVGLGVEYYRCLTHTLTAIDMMGGEYPVELKRKPIPAVMIDSDGNKLPYNVIIPEGEKPPDNTLLRSLLSPDELIEWRFHGTTMFATEARVVTERLIDAARRGVTVYGTVPPPARPAPALNQS